MLLFAKDNKSSLPHLVILAVTMEHWLKLHSVFLDRLNTYICINTQIYTGRTNLSWVSHFSKSVKFAFPLFLIFHSLNLWFKKNALKRRIYFGVYFSEHTLFVILPNAHKFVNNSPECNDFYFYSEYMHFCTCLSTKYIPSFNFVNRTTKLQKTTRLKKRKKPF